MPLPQLDRIVELNKGESIIAIKCLTLSEEYLQDHFPRFPVMPGVLMLESLFQASAWLLRETFDFDPPHVILKEARNMKYQDFVAPGGMLRVEAEIAKQDGKRVTLKVQGSMEGKVAVSGRLVLECVGSEEINPAMVALEPRTRQELKQDLELLKYGRMTSPPPQ